MNYYNRKSAAEEAMSPYLYVLFAGIGAIIVGLILTRCEPEPLIAAEKSYNDRKYAASLKEHQDAAIANALRRTAKAKAQRFLTAEDEAIEGFWPGQGRKR